MNAAGGNNEEEKENFVCGLCFKGRFVSQQEACILNNLAKAKSKGPIEKKTFENGEHEPKRVTRSQMVSSSNFNIYKHLQLEMKYKLSWK